MIESPCDCPACQLRRAIICIVLGACAVGFLFAFLHRNDGRDRITIEAIPAELHVCGEPKKPFRIRPPIEPILDADDPRRIA